MRRPFAALLVLVYGWAAAPDVEACSLASATALGHLSPATTVVTGRILRYVSTPNLLGAPRSAATATVLWSASQTTYTSPPVKTDNRVWGVEIEVLQTYRGVLPRHVRVYLYDDGCYWTATRKGDVVRRYRPGEEVGLVTHYRPEQEGGRAVVPGDVHLFQNASGALTTQPDAYRQIGTSREELRALRARVSEDRFRLRYVWEVMGEKVRRVRAASSPYNQRLVNRLEAGWYNELDAVEDQIVSRVTFEMARTWVRATDVNLSPEQRAQHLVRLWGISRSFDPYGRREDKCWNAWFVSRALPDSAAQYWFAAVLPKADLPAYTTVGKTPRHLGCTQMWLQD